MKVAVIDVGFNSLKMVKYRIEPSGSITSYGQMGTMARLGDGLAMTGFLGKEQMARTVEALKLCRESAALDSVKHTILIGTSPVREAANRDEFLRLVRDETGLGMRVLTGNEEALYGYLGASRSVGSPTALYFDLGGGSLELVYAEQNRVKRIMSLPLGALKLTSIFAGEEGVFTRKARAKMEKRVVQSIPSRRELGISREARLFGTGGTVRALARFDQDRIEYPLNKVHNYQVDYGSIQEMSRKFLKSSVEELAQVEAIGEGRARTIAAGALVVRHLMKRLGFEEMTVSTHGVRDGILLEYLGRGPIPTPSPEGLEREVESSQGSFEELPRESDALTKCLVRNGILDLRQEAIVRVALAEGRSRDCVDADPATLFGIMMSKDLPMSHRNQLFTVISLVRARRPRTANWLLKKYGSMVSRDDAKAVRKLGACLRFMEVLDRTGSHYRVAYSGGVRISVSDNGGSFPLDLARVAGLALSTAIKKPVSVFAGVKPKDRRTGIIKEAE